MYTQTDSPTSHCHAMYVYAPSPITKGGSLEFIIKSFLSADSIHEHNIQRGKDEFISNYPIPQNISCCGNIVLFSHIHL